MKLETLDKAKELQSSIKRNEFILDKTQNQKAEWIDFSFGNGSNRENVCDDKDTIEEIRLLLIKKHEAKIQSLKQEFENL